VLKVALEGVLVEMGAGVMVVLEEEVVILILIARPELSIIEIIMDIIKQGIILNGTQILEVLQDLMVLMVTQGMPKSFQEEMAIEALMNSLLNILQVQLNTLKVLMLKCLTSLLTFQKKMKLLSLVKKDLSPLLLYLMQERCLAQFIKIYLFLW
jgi:hypothetical protein